MKPPNTYMVLHKMEIKRETFVLVFTNHALLQVNAIQGASKLLYFIPAYINPNQELSVKEGAKEKVSQAPLFQRSQGIATLGC